MKINTFLLAFAVLFTFFSCKTDKKTEVIDSKETSEVESTKYTLTPFSNSPEFGEASLTNMTYKNGQFNFDVANYELGAQTADASSKMCANSGKGQHIHLIVDSLPYAAKYVNQFEHLVENGEHHILAFLSRSYHESIKNNTAFLANTAKVEDGNIVEMKPIKDPMLFYSRPKGTYVGKGNTEKVMLDFYLTGVKISADGNYVEANINGEVHKITQWQPYYIEGLPMGDNYVSLILRDKEGKAMDIPLNPVKRIFTLKADPTPEG